VKPSPFYEVGILYWYHCSCSRPFRQVLARSLKGRHGNRSSLLVVICWEGRIAGIKSPERSPGRDRAFSRGPGWAAYESHWPHCNVSPRNSGRCFSQTELWRASALPIHSWNSVSDVS